MSIDYKNCPLKKRPIIIAQDYEERVQLRHEYHRATEPEQTEPLSLVKDNSNLPLDLSLKRKDKQNINDYDVPAKHQSVLNLSNKSVSTTCSRSVLPNKPQDISGSSVMLSPPFFEMGSAVEHAPSDIHLRELTAANLQSVDPYRSAFAIAAGSTPMNLVSNGYQHNISAWYQSPARSRTRVASTHVGYTHQDNTPPVSPASDINTELEDLSETSNIPLPALLHLFDESNSHKSSNSTSSSSNVSNADRQIYRFKCNKCNKMYSTAIGLSKHQQFHCPAMQNSKAEKQHVCDFCGKQYNAKGALKVHIRTHNKTWICSICRKAFSREWLLRGHIRTHTGEKPFQCTDCHRAFADRSNLRAHQQTHMKEKKYLCKMCKKSFSRMSLLNKHAASNCVNR